MAAETYNRGKTQIRTGDLDTLDQRILILAGASFPAGVKDKDLKTVTDVLGVAGAVEAAVTGYVRKQLPGVTGNEDDTNDRSEITWTDIVWTGPDPAVGETWRGAICYVEGADDDNRFLMWYDEFAAGVPTNGQQITYQGGTLRIQDAP